VKIRIIAVGHKMPPWVAQGCAEYLKRMPREAMVELVEIKPDKRAAGKSDEQVREAEGTRILEAAGRDLLIALDEHGKSVTTLQLAEKFESWLAGGRDVSLAITIEIARYRDGYGAAKADVTQRIGGAL
jgi:23S rRNA (pseudouridine1915-N3)-methyltransferase